ncbi:MAG: hypothetical protein IVW57_16545 [Ktedonobacterales bacterium]|nr:hypothetical protein [Ktedonobacterales bacterium]
MGDTRVRTAVVNGTGYGGVALLRLLSHHPMFDLVEVTARAEVGKSVTEVFPHLAGTRPRFTEEAETAELVFVALPDDAAVALVPRLLAAGRRVVDLSAGFRLRSAALYPRWYGYEHPAPALLERAVYGLTEWARAALPTAHLVACPGCYPTAALLAVAPALVCGLIEPDVILDAK